MTTKAFAAFNRSIGDAEELLQRFDQGKNSNNPGKGEVLKRAGLVILLASWETYVKDRIKEEISVWLQPVEGSRISGFVQKRIEYDLKRFYNPNSERTRKIFLDYFDLDITEHWSWDNYDPASAKKALDSLVAKRGEAAHQANTAAHPSAEPHKVKRNELEKGIRFLKGLVQASDSVRVAKDG